MNTLCGGDFQNGDEFFVYGGAICISFSGNCNSLTILTDIVYLQENFLNFQL